MRSYYHLSFDNNNQVGNLFILITKTLFRACVPAINRISFNLYDFKGQLLD